MTERYVRIGRELVDDGMVMGRKNGSALNGVGKFLKNCCGDGISVVSGSAST